MNVKKSVTWTTSKTSQELVSLILPDNGSTTSVQIKVWPFTLTAEEAREMVIALNSALDWIEEQTPFTAPAPQPV